MGTRCGSRLLISVLLVFATLAVAGFSLARAQHRYLVDRFDRLLEAVPPAGYGPASADGTAAMPPGARARQRSASSTSAARRTAGCAPCWPSGWASPSGPAARRRQR
ncbi:MAG: hypothetical protein R2755_09400 [Acidimicrobiales bacterium]